MFGKFVADIISSTLDVVSFSLWNMLYVRKTKSTKEICHVLSYDGRGWEGPVLSIHKLEACVVSEQSPGPKDVRTRSQKCKPQFKSHRAWLLSKAFMLRKEEAISWLTEGRVSLPLFFPFQAFSGWAILYLYQSPSVSLLIPFLTSFRHTAAGTLASNSVPAVTLSKEHIKWATKGPPIVSWAPHTFLAYAWSSNKDNNEATVLARHRNHALCKQMQRPHPWVVYPSPNIVSLKWGEEQLTRCIKSKHFILQGQETHKILAAHMAQLLFLAAFLCDPIYGPLCLHQAAQPGWWHIDTCSVCPKGHPVVVS